MRESQSIIFFSAKRSMPMPYNILHRLWQYLLQLNLYQKSASDANTAPKEKIATRLYLFSLAVAIIIITIIAASLARTVYKIEYSPRQARFSYLANKYPDTISCPCSTIGISYDAFVTAHARFHQVCSSQFVQQAWIDAVFAQQNDTSFSSDDFRISLSFFWQIIAGFCKISNTTWSDIVAGFNASSAFNPVAITEQAIRSQVRVALENAIYSARTTLIRNLLAIQRAMSGNQIASALATNFYLAYPAINPILPNALKLSPRLYHNCSCLHIQGCPHPATINNTYGQLMTIPGMITDCFVMDATLASTLECYYHESCLSLLHPSLSIHVQLLSDELNSNFAADSTIEMLLNRIMIDDVISDVRFDVFYSQCNPSYCSYTYAHRLNVLFIATTIIGVFGGISFVLRAIAPLLATLILRWKNRHMRQNDESHSTALQRKRCKLLSKSYLDLSFCQEK